MEPPRLLVVESQRAIRDALAASPASELFAVSWTEAPSAATLAQPKLPHLILIDLCVLDAPAIALLASIARRFRNIPLLAVTGPSADPQVVGALRAGATGCLFREDLARRLLPAIHEALQGGAPMSRAVTRLVLERARARRHSSMQMPRVDVGDPPPEIGARKREILEMMERGLSYEQMALALGISVNTVRSHVRELYELLQVSTKVEAVMAAVERGILKHKR